MLTPLNILSLDQGKEIALREVARLKALEPRPAPGILAPAAWTEEARRRVHPGGQARRLFSDWISGSRRQDDFWDLYNKTR